MAAWSDEKLRMNSRWWVGSGLLFLAASTIWLLQPGNRWRDLVIGLWIAAVAFLLPGLAGWIRERIERRRESNSIHARGVDMTGGQVRDVPNATK